MDEDKNTDDLLTIMLATDIHLGVHEKDGIRADDSFVTFEEILKLCREKDVDFLLLGGDLFHDSKPSPLCLHKCLALLRKYCMGDKPIMVEFLSDQRTVFKNNDFPTVNYEDPNYNISLPVFSIHGNHDDPSGFGRKSALDLLSVTGFVNYFGKWTDLNNIKMYPLIFKKNTTKLAIYGLSHIKDERLYRLMKHNEIEYILPKDDPDRYFKLMVLHQNRVTRAGTDHIPESLIPSFMDLVFWGHEHECRVKQEWNSEKEFYVTQPGSSVATSLCEGEAVEKMVAVLKIRGQDFKLQAIPLQTVRPFVFDTVNLADWKMKSSGREHRSEVVQEYVDRYVRTNLLEKCNDLKSGSPDQPTLPLIRLRIEFEDENDCFNPIRFGQTFTGLVANPSEMEVNSSIADLIDQYFDGASEKANMTVLTRVWMAEATSRFVDKDDKEALNDVVYNEMKNVRTYLEKQTVDPDNIPDFIGKFYEMRLNRKQEEIEKVRLFLDSDTRQLRDTKEPVQFITQNKQMIISDDEDDDFGPPLSTTKEANTSSTRGSRGRGRGRGRGSRGSRGSRGAKNSDLDSSDMITSRTNSGSTTRRLGSTTSTSRTITSYLRRNGDSPDDNEDFSVTSYKPSPKKKMKFTYVDE